MARRGQDFQPTEEHRRQVETMAGFGVPHGDIARLIGVDGKTLRKHFRNDIDNGVAKANLRVSQTLFQQAQSGNTAAIIFWLKVRAGWSQRDGGGDDVAVESGPTQVIYSWSGAALPEPVVVDGVCSEE